MNGPAPPHPVASGWEKVRLHLEKRQAETRRQIGDYPRPIPACDQHFNHLLAQRERLSQELAQARAASQEPLPHAQGAAALGRFVAASSCLDDAATQDIRSCLS